jgi:hypothetical protein
MKTYRVVISVLVPNEITLDLNNMDEARLAVRLVLGLRDFLADKHCTDNDIQKSALYIEDIECTGSTQ